MVKLCIFEEAVIFVFPFVLECFQFQLCFYASIPSQHAVFGINQNFYRTIHFHCFRTCHHRHFQFRWNQNEPDHINAPQKENFDGFNLRDIMHQPKDMKMNKDFGGTNLN